MKIDGFVVTVWGVPDFPSHLATVAQDKVLGGDEAAEFLKWWSEAASARGWNHPRRPLGEEWVHARRLLSRYSVPYLKDRAVRYFAEAAEEWHGVKLLRGFVVWLRGHE